MSKSQVLAERRVEREGMVDIGWKSSVKYEGAWLLSDL
jgi:hypothetical protein